VPAREAGGPGFESRSGHNFFTCHIGHDSYPFVRQSIGFIFFCGIVFKLECLSTTTLYCAATGVSLG